MITYFIADLHLSEKRPDITELFLNFLQSTATQADALYILGDLFDAWIGDDDLTPFHQQVMQGLKHLTDQGVPCYFIAGNRDFLIGQDFFKATGVQGLSEPSVINLYGTPTLILHGDTLCTLDIGYQRFRKFIRHPLLLACAKKLPLSWRRGIAQRLRAQSKTNRALSPEQLKKMDATESAVQQHFKRFQATQMIHGHTHKPNMHLHEVTPQQTPCLRIVLGDWYEQGSVLAVRPQSNHLQTRSL